MDADTGGRDLSAVVDETDFVAALLSGAGELN